jgi:hypothetical protein
MLQEYIKKQQDKNQKGDFYTSSGIHVYHKEKFHCDDIDLELAVAKYESILPTHLLSEIEMIVVGWFEEFDERSLSALYKDGAIYISSLQDDNQELYEDLIHETFHSLESPHGMSFYGDEKIKEEFLRKRKYLHDVMWEKGFKIPQAVFMDVEYNEDLDLFLFQQVGYDKLSSLMMGIFIDPYAATSLSEYAATGFTEYYTNSDHKYLQKTSPSLYEKLILLQKEETLDNQH